MAKHRLASCPLTHGSTLAIAYVTCLRAAVCAQFSKAALVSPYQNCIAQATVLVVDSYMGTLGLQVSEALGTGKALESSLDAYTLKRLTADVEAQLTTLKNSAYAMGHVAGKEEVAAYAQRRFS